VEWVFVLPVLKVSSACQYAAEFMTFRTQDPPLNKNNKLHAFFEQNVAKIQRSHST